MREYTPPTWPQIIRHLTHVKEVDRLRNKQLEKFHTHQTETLTRNLSQSTTAPRDYRAEQSLKKMLWEDKVTHLRDPLIVPRDPQSPQASASLHLNLMWIKALKSIAKDNPDSEQVLLRLQHLRVKSSTEKASTEHSALHPILPKKDLDHSFFDNLLNLLTSSSPTLIANLSSSQEEMHSLALAILNKDDLWVHDPFKGSFLCKDKEKLKDFLTKFCHENYPNHLEASIVHPGKKLKQKRSTKSTLSNENTPSKNFSFSPPAPQEKAVQEKTLEEKTKQSSDKDDEPEHRPRGPGFKR